MFVSLGHNKSHKLGSLNSRQVTQGQRREVQDQNAGEGRVLGKASSLVLQWRRSPSRDLLCVQEEEGVCWGGEDFECVKRKKITIDLPESSIGVLEYSGKCACLGVDQLGL